MKKKFLLILLSILPVAVFGQSDTASVKTPVVVEPSTPRVVKSLSTFKRLQNGTVAELGMSCDTVLYVNGDEAFVRSGSGGAIMFVKSGLDLKEGQVLSGSVTGRKDMQGEVVVFIGTDATNASKLEVVGSTSVDRIARQVELQGLLNGENSAQADSYVSDLVVVDSVEIAATATVGSTRHFTARRHAGGQTFELVDKYGCCQSQVEVGRLYTDVRGILTVSGSSYQLYLLNDFGQNGVTDVKAAVVNEQRGAGETYDLHGRRLPAASAKGIYISNGRKTIVNAGR